MPNRIYPALAYLTHKVEDALEADGSPVARVIEVAPGSTVAWDDCCAGQLHSRLTNLTAVYGKQRTADGNRCAPLAYRATCEIGVLRCAAVVDDRGNAPKPSAITLDGLASTNDMVVILNVLCAEDGIDSILQWVPSGPEGGCHGGVWTFTLNLPA